MTKRFGCLALLGALFLGGLATYRAAHPPRLGGAAFSQLPPQVKQERRAQAQDLVKQIEAVAREARKKESATKQTFVVRASEDQLNTLLQDRLRTEKFPVSDLRVGLTQDLLSLQGTVKYGGVEWPATIAGTLGAQDGALTYQIDSLAVTGLPAPAKLRDKAQKAIESGLRKGFAARGRARIDAVEIALGELTVRGQTG